jgi:5'-nucleotidase (lipoprotein e(P4) family)
LKRTATILVCLFLALWGACAQEAPGNILWAGTAAEHYGVYAQAYTLARVMLDRALVDKTWTAALEQKGSGFRSLPPAIVMDLDETILDNIAYEARLALGAGSSTEDKWQTWVDEARAVPLPGALEFAKYAKSRGVTIFYITNRNLNQKKATRANLERAGFPLDPKLDTLYCKLDKPEWTSDKSIRRAEVAKKYRILLLFGDDLGDFTTGHIDTIEKRQELAARYADRWGTKWIVLPNAMYGSWSSAIYAPNSNPTVRQARELELDVMRKLAGQPAAPTPAKK